MTRAIEHVLEDFLHHETEQLPPTTGSPYERLFRPGSQRRHVRRRLVGPMIAAAAVVVVVAAGATVFGGLAHDTTSGSAGGRPLIPAEISTPGSVPSVLDHPMDRAALLIQTSTASQPNAISSDPILVSPDGKTYRALPTIEAGAAPGSVNVSSFALSPDGTRVAYATWTRAAPDSAALHVVDLPTGVIRSFSMPGSGKGEKVGTITWSPDGTRIAYSAGSITVLAATSAREGQETQDDAILDLATGRHMSLPAAPLDWSADGRQLLLGPPYASGPMYRDVNPLEIVDSAGKVVRALPTGSLLNVELGGGIWSSVGHAVATVTRDASPSESWNEPHQYALQITSDQTGQPKSRITLGSLVGVASVLGWQDASHVAISERVPNHAMQVVSVNVRTGTLTVLTRATSARITNIQVASALLAE